MSFDSGNIREQVHHLDSEVEVDDFILEILEYTESAEMQRAIPAEIFTARMLRVFEGIDQNKKWIVIAEVNMYMNIADNELALSKLRFFSRILNGAVLLDEVAITTPEERISPTVSEVGRLSDLPISLAVSRQESRGYFYFLPRKSNCDDVFRKNNLGAYVDRSGNYWIWDRLHRDHWDVFHPRNPITTHLNITKDGRIL